MGHKKHTSFHIKFPIALWLLFVACATGCAMSSASIPVEDLKGVAHSSTGASTNPPPDRRDSPPDSDFMTILPARSEPSLAQAEPVPPSIATVPHPSTCSDPLVSPRSTNQDCSHSRLAVTLLEEPFPRNDVPLRPPLRQLWFQHPRLVPLGDDIDFNIPHGEQLAHRNRFRSGPFRNPYGGLRDQALLHRDTSRDPVNYSTLPEIGPPPPKSSIKTLLTLGGLSLVGAGVYAFAPTSFTGSKKDGQWEDAWGHFKEAWTKPPVFDKDGNGVNYLGHPYFGANYYLSQRNLGESPLYSFLFSVFCSTFFEYMLESWSERPSINDLIVTPVVGSVLGEFVHVATQQMRENGFTTAEKIAVTVINPLYVLQNGYR